MDDDLYFSRSSRPQDTARGSGMVFYDDQEAERQKRASRKPAEKIRITDEGAYKRFLQRCTETVYESIESRKENIKMSREHERKLREGPGWVPPPVDAQPDAAKVRAFDEKIDYYSALGVDRAASSREITKVYKRKALELHPDKHSQDMDESDRAKLQIQFQEVVTAYEVLVDEPTRRAYDEFIDGEEVRGKTFGAPRKGPPPARRYGKRAKGLATEVDFRLDLCSLFHGCVEPVNFTRRVFDERNQCTELTKMFHIMVPAGAQPGRRFVFPSEGDESTTMEPGDVVFVLRDATPPHDVFLRRGQKDIVFQGTRIESGQVVFCETFKHLSGASHTVIGECARECMAGTGGVAITALVGLGMPPPPVKTGVKEPAGNLLVEVDVDCLKRPCGKVQEQKTSKLDVACIQPFVLSSCLKPRPIYLLNYETTSITSAQLNAFGSHLTKWLPSIDISCGAAHRQPTMPTTATSAGLCLRLARYTAHHRGRRDDVDDYLALPTDHILSGPAAGVMATLSSSYPTLLSWRVVVMEVGTSACALLDEEVLALCAADVVIIDGSNLELLAEGAPPMWHVPLQFQENWSHPSMPSERASAAVALAFGRSSVGHIVWQRYWTGALLVGVGAGVAVLGRPGPWIYEQVSNVEMEEEDIFGAMPQPIIEKPDWLDAWECSAALPIILRASVGERAGASENHGAELASAGDEWALLEHTCAHLELDIPGVLRSAWSAGGASDAAAGLGLSDGTMLAVWPWFQVELFAGGKVARRGYPPQIKPRHNRAHHLTTEPPNTPGGQAMADVRIESRVKRTAAGGMCTAISGTVGRATRQAEQKAREKALRLEEERQRMESAIRATQERRERAERLRAERASKPV